jgi:UDP-2,3-diacylglucosamine pyrophosphatase LpxH
MPTNKYRSVFISDVHLGSRACQADKLCEFLKHHTSDTLYLVGDILDLWKLKRHVYWPQSHSNVIRRILTAAKRDTQVKYVLGNHDEDLRNWFGDLHHVMGNMEIANQFDHVTVQGDRLLVTHGDLFDGVIRYHKWLSLLGDRLYTGALWLNSVINKLRSWCGKDYWSFSNYAKTQTKQAVAFITKFEEFLSNHALSLNYQGVICGHIHTPCMKLQDHFVYMNTGDWCETLSAILETHEGEFQLWVWDTQIGALTQQHTWNTPT